MKPFPVLAILATLGCASGSRSPEPTPGAVPQGVYRFAVGDTLRYAERTEGRITMQSPAGTIEMRSEHDAAIGITFFDPDSAHAWYDALRLRQVIPGAQERSPSTAGVLGEPYVLSVSPRGHVTVRATPVVPQEIASVTDLAHQFDDFFITLPGQPLRPGLEWADTIRSDRAGRPSDTFSATGVRAYRVVGDTAVDGAAAALIAVRMSIQIASRSTLGDGVSTVHTTLGGRDEGVAIVSTSEGKLLARSRSGKMEGDVALVGGITMRQVYDYTTTLRLIR